MEVSKVELLDPDDLSKMTESEFHAMASLVSGMAMDIRNESGGVKTLKEARAQAADEVGASLKPPVTGKELESAMAKVRSALYKDARIAGIKKAAERKRLEKAERLAEAERLKKEADRLDMLESKYLPEPLGLARDTYSNPSGARRHEDGTIERFDVPIVIGRQTKPRLKTTDASSTGSRQEKSTVDLYREWVQENDVITNDAELSHFTGKGQSTFANARMVLSKDGYSFKKEKGRWHVTVRPDTKKYSESEVRSMIDEVLKKVGGSK